MQELAHILAAFAPKHYVHMVWHSAISQHPHGSELAWRYPTHRRVCPQLNRRALPTDRLLRMCKRMRTRPHKCCASVTFFFIRQAARRDLRSRLRLRATEATNGSIRMCRASQRVALLHNIRHPFRLHLS